jgi:NitT/TauT family transport system permease protein
LAAHVQPRFIAAPWPVFSRVWEWTLDGTIWWNLSATLKEVGVGFSLAVVVGIAAGWILASSRWLEAGTQPFIDMMNALPRIGLAPLFILWFGLGLQSKIVLVFSVVVFVVMVNIHAGIKGVDRDFVLLAKSLGASEIDVIRKIVFPSVVPWLLSSFRLGAAYAVATAVVGEVVASDRGIGFLLSYRTSVFDTTGAFAALLVIAIIAWLVAVAIKLLETRTLAWRSAGEDGPSRVSAGAGV